MIRGKKPKEKYFTYQMDAFKMNILAVVLFFGISLIMYKFVIGGGYVIRIDKLVVIVLWMILHELIHYVAFIIPKDVNEKNVTVGIYLEKGIFYCMCKQEISKKNILFSLCAPLFIIGIFTFILGVLLNNNLLTLLSIINISGSIGDIIMTILILKMPNDIRYVDFDDPTSFTLLTKKDVSKINVFGLDLIKHGFYDKKTMHAKDFTKFGASTLSKIIMVIIVLVYIVLLFV